MTHPTPRTGLLPLLALAAAALPLLPACQQTGRIGVSETTEAEIGSRKILPEALIEFSDQAPRRLVQDLTSLPLVSQTDAPVTVIMGSLNNRTQIVSTEEFELAASRLRNNLLNSAAASEKLRFVENRARMEQLSARERVASEGYLADPPDYDPQTTYALSGDFYRVGRGETSLYYMEFQLVNFATNQIMFSDRYEVKQVRD